MRVVVILSIVMEPKKHIKRIEGFSDKSKYSVYRNGDDDIPMFFTLTEDRRQHRKLLEIPTEHGVVMWWVNAEVPGQRARHTRHRGIGF